MDNEKWREYPLLVEDMIWLASLRVGDPVRRLLGGVCPMDLRVTEIHPDRVVCGGWEFDPRTGAEIDEELGWHAFASGSFIRRPPANGSDQ